VAHERKAISQERECKWKSGGRKESGEQGLLKGGSPHVKKKMGSLGRRRQEEDEGAKSTRGLGGKRNLQKRKEEEQPKREVYIIWR